MESGKLPALFMWLWALLFERDGADTPLVVMLIGAAVFALLGALFIVKVGMR